MSHIVIKREDVIVVTENTLEGERIREICEQEGYQVTWPSKLKDAEISKLPILVGNVDIQLLSGCSILLRCDYDWLFDNFEDFDEMVEKTPLYQFLEFINMPPQGKDAQVALETLKQQEESLHTKTCY